MTGEAWFIAGTIPFILAGGLHVVLALRDTARPTYFTPIDRSVRPMVEGTGIRLAGSRTPSMWTVWLGIHLTHGLGAFAFGLLCLLVAVHDFDLVVQIDALRPLAIAVSAAYLAISLRFFFYVPSMFVGTGAGCFTIAILVPA